MSWFVVLVAIALSGGCLLGGDPEVFCGDDVGYYEGLDVEVTGGDEATTYTFVVEAEDASLMVAGFAEASSVDLGDGRTMSGYVQATSEPFVMTLNTTVSDGDLHGTGPTTALVIVHADGIEVARHSFTPTYGRLEPWGPTCRSYEYAVDTLALE